MTSSFSPGTFSQVTVCYFPSFSFRVEGEFHVESNFISYQLGGWDSNGVRNSLLKVIRDTLTLDPDLEKAFRENGVIYSILPPQTSSFYILSIRPFGENAGRSLIEAVEADLNKRGVW